MQYTKNLDERKEEQICVLKLTGHAGKGEGSMVAPGPRGVEPHVLCPAAGPTAWPL